MKRFSLLVALALFVTSSGCCLFHPWGGGYGCGYGGYGAGYGATYQGYGAGNCPGGNCGTMPGAYLGAPASTAMYPYGTPIAGAPIYSSTAALPLNYAPY